MIYDTIKYHGEDYTASVELLEYEGQQAAVLHTDVLKNTPRVMRKLEQDFVDLMVVLKELGVGLLLAHTRADDPGKLKFQMRWGFYPWRVHETDHGDYIVSKHEGF